MTTPSAPSVALRYAAARVASGVYFHGTSEEAARKIMQQGFSLRSMGQRQRAVHGHDTLDPKGVFVTSDLMQARWYAGPDPKRPGLNRGGAVVEVKVSGRMMSESDWWKSKSRISEEMGITGMYDPRRGEVVLRAQEEAKKQGYAGFLEHGDEYVVFDPKNVKPVRAFHARSGEPLSKTASRIDAPPVMLKEITEWVQRVLAGEALADVEEAREKAENQLREIEGGTSSMTRGPFAIDPETARSLLLEKLAEMDRVERKARRFRPLSSRGSEDSLVLRVPLDLSGWRYRSKVEDGLARRREQDPGSLWLFDKMMDPVRVVLYRKLRKKGQPMAGATWRSGQLTFWGLPTVLHREREFDHWVKRTAPRIVRHELQHMAQEMLREATQVETAGLPSSGRPGWVDDPSLDLGTAHALRDIEFYPRLQDDIDTFRESVVGVRDLNRAVKVWTGALPESRVDGVSVSPSEFFIALKKHDRRKYRKAVGEFWAAVSEGGTPSYRSASKTAARPLRLDRSAVNRLLDDLYKQVERSSSGRSRRELGYGWLAESTFTVTTPKGDRREVIVELNTVPMKPSFRGVVVKGGYGYIKGKDDLKVSLTLNGSLTPDQFLNRRRTEKEIRAAMMHELTHASEVKGTLADLKGGSAYDYLNDPDAYHNDPNEVRAWMRQVYEEIRDDPRAGVVPIEVLLENNRWWKQAEPHLTRKSRNRILKGLVTAFEDEGIEVRPTRKTAARPIRLPTREIKTLAKKLAAAYRTHPEDENIIRESDAGWGKGGLSKQRYWYHQSPARNRESISDSGLLTRFDGGGGGTPVGIYMTRYLPNDGHSDVWRVDVKGLRLHDDPHSGEEPELGLSVYTKNDIPPRRLLLHTKQRAAKTAARPIRLPTREIKTLAKRLAQRLYQYGLPKPGRVTAQEYLPITNVKGDEVVVEILLTGSPGRNRDPFGSKLLNGGFIKRRPEGPLMRVFVNPHLDPRTFEMRPRRIVEDELYGLLAHELTHAADIWSGKGSVGDLSGSMGDLKKHHHNHPAEVKALMRDVVTHLDDGDTIREFMDDYGMDFNTALREALKDTKWPDIEPYLNPRNKKTILKGVYTFLQDQGLDEVTR